MAETTWRRSEEAGTQDVVRVGEAGVTTMLSIAKEEKYEQGIEITEERLTRGQG